MVIHTKTEEKMEDDTKTDRQNLKYSGSYAPSQTFVAAALLFFPEPLQLLNFCTYSKQKARTNTIVANTKYTIQWQIHKSKQSLNDPLAFCEQRPAGANTNTLIRNKYNGGKRKYTRTIAK